MRQIALWALAAPAAASLSLATPAAAATAEFMNGQGQSVGKAELTELTHGVVIRLDLQNLPEGWHGFHLHGVGQCEGPDFKSAGGHYNPASVHHGFKDRQGPHAGDLPNVYVGSDGRAKVEQFTNFISLGGREPNIFDGDGAALVIHAKPDDYQTDPAGDSGDRIACGVIKK